MAAGAPVRSAGMVRADIHRIVTGRLVLRPLSVADCARLVLLAGDYEVASRTTDMPWPFSAADAAPWLVEAEGEVRRAIDLGGELIGAIGYFRRASGIGELGYWIGRPWWGHGYVTEAGRALLASDAARAVPAFAASHFIDNPASGRVLRKLGFSELGRAHAFCVARGLELETVEYWRGARAQR